MRALGAARRVVGGMLAVLLAVHSAAAGDEGPPPPARPRPAPRMTREPSLVRFVPATFPPGEARSSDVVLALTIDLDGRVRDASVLASGGGPFDDAAVAAARGFEFEPAEVDGHPAAVRIKYTYHFTYAPPAPPPVATAPAVPAVAARAPESAPPRAAEAEDVRVRGVRRAHDALDVTVGAAEARKVAGTQGDPIKVLENLPGTARPAFGSGQIVVWGAAPEETRTYIDGVEIPALFHGSALRSTVNGDLVKDVTLTPGAYGADYGRSLGGIVRVETKDLPASGVHGYLGADTLDASGMLSAAPSDRVRIAVAGRVGWLDSVLHAVGAPDVGDFLAVPRYRDYQAKVQVALRAGESVDAVLLGSSDALTRTLPDADPAHARRQATESDFQRVYARYRRTLDDGSTLEIVPWVGHDASSLDARFGANPARLDQQTWRWGLRASHRSRPAPHVALVLGVDADGAHARVQREGSLGIPAREGDVTVLGQPPGDDTSADTWRASVVDVAPYVIVPLDLGPLTLTPGLRVDAYLSDTSRQTPRVGQTPSIGLSQLDAAVSPRLAARLRVTGRFALLAAAGTYTQPPAPSDRSAVFGTPTLGVTSAEHASVGESVRLTGSLSAEAVAFYRWSHDLAVRDPSTTPKLAQALVQTGTGRSYGLQLLLRQQPWRGISGWIAYTISRSERRAADAPGATYRLFDYDQPHVLTVVASKELGPWSFGARFRYATGLPRTPVVGGFYDVKDDAFQPVFGPQSSIRLPSFWQLDVRVDRRFALGDAARLVVYVEGLNVSSRANAEEYVYSADYTRRGVVTGLPVIAVLGARVEL